MPNRRSHIPPASLMISIVATGDFTFPTFSAKNIAKVLAVMISPPLIKSPMLFCN